MAALLGDPLPADATGGNQPRGIWELPPAKIAAGCGHWVCQSHSWRGTGRGRERDSPTLSGAARLPGKYLCPLSKAHQKARTANGTGGETGRSALPPTRPPPATCSPIESPARRLQSSRIHDAQALQRLARQMCGVAVRREPPQSLWAFSRPSQGDRRTGGKDAPRRDAVFTRTRPASRIARTPRAIRDDAPSICGRISGGACLSRPIFCGFRPPSGQRGEPATRKDVGKGQA